MKRFLIGIALFMIVGLALGEIIARSFVLTSDIPRRMLNDNQIQKYVPGQKGYWKGGGHQWQVNKFGWPGQLPEEYDNLITVIGDSFIENFMNPDSCHQAILLKRKMPGHNFIEASRSGISFIEAMEITKELDSLNPKLHLIYLTDSDFDQSVVQINKMGDVTQWDAETGNLIHGKLKSPGLKSILYNWKFMFYLYRRFQSSFNKIKTGDEHQHPVKKEVQVELGYYTKLLEYVRSEYNIDDKVFVFRDDSSTELISLVKEHGYLVVELDESNDSSWSFEHDSHWTCYGHERASHQVVLQLHKFIGLFEKH